MTSLLPLSNVNRPRHHQHQLLLQLLRISAAVRDMAAIVASVSPFLGLVTLYPPQTTNPPAYPSIFILQRVLSLTHACIEAAGESIHHHNHYYLLRLKKCLATSECWLAYYYDDDKTCCWSGTTRLVTQCECERVSDTRAYSTPMRVGLRARP